MIKHSSLEEIEQYRLDPGISQSFLKTVLANKTEEFKETLPMILGSLLDCILTSPALVDVIYAPSLAKRPSDKIKEIVDVVLELAMKEESPSTDIHYWKDNLLVVARQKEYQSRWGDDAILNTFLKEAESYWNETVGNRDKILVTQAEWDAMHVAASLTLSSHVTGKYFIDQEKVDKYFQLPIFWNHKGTPCKGLIDELIIEHETKTIYIIDFKGSTANSLKEWFNIARNKNYNFQMSWYYRGVVQNFQDLISDGYSIECRWVVIPLSNKFKPWIVPCTSLMLQAGRYGTKYLKTVEIGKVELDIEYEREGWNAALEIYLKCKENDWLDWDYSWYESNGKLDQKLANNYFF